jgi:hypothetical protein
LNNTLEVIVTPSKLATTADVEMSEHGTFVETASTKTNHQRLVVRYQLFQTFHAGRKGT